MSWCGRCLAAQTTSDFESEDDGEYEYFVNSPYICVRKKSEDSSTRTAQLVEGRSSFSRAGGSETSSNTAQRSSVARSRNAMMRSQKDSSSVDASDMNSSIASSELKDARVWQVAHATIKPNDPSIQAFFDTSTSESDRTLEIVFDTPRREAGSPSQIKQSPDHPMQAYRAGSRATTATSMVTIDHNPVMTPKKRPGFIQRLFGRSGKQTSPLECDVKGHSSLFKECMELPSPAETTKTLYWTFKVKLK